MIRRDKLYKFIYLLIPISLVTEFFDFYLGITKITFVLKMLGLIATLMVLRSSIRRCDNSSKIKNFAVAFLCYYVFTSVFYIFNGRPLVCLLNEYYNFIPALCFFFIGMSDPDKENKLYRYFLLACTISMIIGLGLYVTTPGWYITRYTELANKAWFASYNYSENDILSTLRFSSYLGDTYIVNIYAIVALSISLFAYYYTCRLKSSDNRKIRWYLFLCICVNFISAIMTQQRVAMAVGFIILVAYLIYGIVKGYGRTSFRIIFVFSLLLLFVIVYAYSHFADRMDMFKLLLSGRMENMSFSKAMGERNYQMDLLKYHWDSPILGMGAGSGESIARSLGFPGVSDCSYIALLYDTGIVGGFLFLAIMLKSILRGLHFLKYYLVELGIMFFVLVAMIGSNTIHMGLMCTLPFWYAVGRIWNKDYLKYAIENKIYV